MVHNRGNSGFREAPHLGQAGLRHVAGVDAGQTLALPVDVEHDPDRLGIRLVEHRTQHPHHEFLGGEVVVVEEYLPHGGRLELALGAGPGERPATFFGRSTGVLGHPPL
jgi:hypothetical protein